VISLRELNYASSAEFVSVLAGVFEHSPWVPERGAASRPFTSRLSLLEAMREIVARASRDEQLALICAHPELAGKAAIRDELTHESKREQKGAGLDACTPEEFVQLQQLNTAYRERFAFPFIAAVRGHTPSSIIDKMQERLLNDPDAERETALREIGAIAGFRLADLVTCEPGVEIMAMIDALAKHSDDEGQLTCAYLRPAHRATAAQIREWMLAAGLSVDIDTVGNVVGSLRCNDPHAKTLMTGSHYDTVIDAGRYDGRLGVVLPIVVASSLRQRGISLPFDLEIIAFADEEGVRFSTTFIGSSAVAGCFDERVLDLFDTQGVSMRAALLEAGLDPGGARGLGRNREKVLGFIEVHIEQGPVLLNANRALGIVTSIAGSVRYRVSIVGESGHAGTVPMALRHDAAAAAAEIVLAVERRCSTTQGLVGTVGRLEIPNGAVNVIPGRCDLTIDLRAPASDLRDAALTDVLSEIERIAARRGVRIEATKLMSADAVPCSARLQAQLASSIARVTGDASAPKLASGAGHDAMKMASLTGIVMLFVRCGAGGVSHHPDETMTTGDADLAARVFEDFLLNFRTDA
jgi:N-carbamoyl-L-amino-acid hydrolase